MNLNSFLQEHESTCLMLSNGKGITVFLHRSMTSMTRALFFLRSNLATDHQSRSTVLLIV